MYYKQQLLLIYNIYIYTIIGLYSVLIEVS